MTFALLFAAAESDPAWALFVCAILAVALLVYTFSAPREIAHGTEKTRLSYLKERKEQVYENLRDLNFEHKAGKLPDADYQPLHASLESEAAGLLAEIEQLESGDKDSVYTNVSGAWTQSNPKGARS